MRIGQPVQQIAHQCQPALLLIVEVHQRPRRAFRMRRFQHSRPRLGVILVFVARGQIDRRQFPAFQRVFQALFQTFFLPLLIGRQPVFQQENAIIDQHLLEGRRLLQKQRDLRFIGISHHSLDPGPIVPAPIEQHDLARRWQMRDVTLKIPLRLFACRWFRQRRNPALPWVQSLGYCTNCAALPRRITALEQYADTRSGRPRPAGHRHQLLRHRFKQFLICLTLQFTHAALLDLSDLIASDMPRNQL